MPSTVSDDHRVAHLKGSSTIGCLEQGFNSFVNYWEKDPSLLVPEPPIFIQSLKNKFQCRRSRSTFTAKQWISDSLEVLARVLTNLHWFSLCNPANNYFPRGGLHLELQASNCRLLGWFKNRWRYLWFFVVNLF